MTAPPPSIKFYQARDGRRLATRVWTSSAATVEVVFLHGIVSHGGWYLSSCQHLADAGYGVHFLERRGSGLNGEQSGDVDRWQTWLEDVSDYLKLLPEDRPRILLGISWGGILATAYARHHANSIAGLGLVCPGLVSRRAANSMQRAGMQLAKSIGLSNMKVDVPLKEPSLFTDSPRSQAYVENDPLKLRKITIRFAVENQKLLHEATSAPEEVNVPVLLILSGKDPIVDNAATRAMIERTSHPEKQIIEYPNASHTLEFEDDPSEYFRDLEAFVTRHQSS